MFVNDFNPALFIAIKDIIVLFQNRIMSNQEFRVLSIEFKTRLFIKIYKIQYTLFYNLHDNRYIEILYVNYCCHTILSCGLLPRERIRTVTEEDAKELKSSKIIFSILLFLFDFLVVLIYFHLKF